MVEKDQRGSPKEVPYKQFVKLPDSDIEVGMIVKKVDPSKLYVSQYWTDDEKMGIALAALQESVAPQESAAPLLIPVYAHRLTFANGISHRALIIADRHHRALVWTINGLQIDAEIQATSLPERYKKMSIIPFSRFRRLHEAEVLRI